MKYALCLHGLASGTTDIGNKVDWTGAYPYFKKNVLRDDVDIFIHTWGSPTGLIDTYCPVSYICEEQLPFPGIPETRSIYSRWYSARQSYNLAFKTNHKYNSEYQEDKYTGILLVRYDLVFKSLFPWDSLNSKCFWTPKWREKPAKDSGYLDYWFYSNPENMGKMTLLDLNLHRFFQSGIKENGHNVVDAQIKESGFNVNQWGEQPEDFQLLRRFLGATN